MFEKSADKKDNKGFLAHVSSILHDVCLLMAGNISTGEMASVAPVTPMPAAPAIAMTSPAKNTPSKLNHFLHFAEDSEKLGVKPPMSFLLLLKDMVLILWPTLMKRSLWLAA